MTPTQRTLAALRAEGYQAAIVEKWNPHVKIRQDVWKFGDILACRVLPDGSNQEIALIQCTTQVNAAARVTKIITTCREAACKWLQAGGNLVVWGWAKRGPRGKRKTWSATRTQIELPDVDQDFEVKDPRVTQ